MKTQFELEEQIQKHTPSPYQLPGYSPPWNIIRHKVGVWESMHIYTNANTYIDFHTDIRNYG